MEDLAEFVRHCAAQEEHRVVKPFLVGTSMGGALAVATAMEHPALAAGLARSPSSGELLGPSRAAPQASRPAPQAGPEQ